MDYCTITVRGGVTPSRLSALGRTLYAATVPGGCVVFPEPDPAAPDLGDLLAHTLSGETHGAVLLSDVRDDALRLRLFDNGVTVDEYETEPDAMDGETHAPRGGNADVLLTAFGLPATDRTFLDPLLRAPRYDDDYGYGAASERHAEIADLLGTPAIAGIGYVSIARGKMPDGVLPTDLQHTVGNAHVWQFALIHAPEGTSETEIASYLLPNVVSLERGIETDDWVSDFGTLSAVRDAVVAAFSIAAHTGAAWLTLPLPDAALHFDFGFKQDTDTVETIRGFLVAAAPEAKAIAMPYLAHFADAIGGTIWDWETRRVVLSKSSEDATPRVRYMPEF